MMKIYTGAGDYGNTILARGTEVLKDDIRVEAHGVIDRSNSFICLLASYVEDPFLEVIQINLFKVGGYFADEIKTLEVAIYSIESQLEPLHNFFFPEEIML